MLRLYYARNSCALASHIALEESGAPYEAVRIDFGSAQQRGPEYLKINPKGRVPSLQTERGILTETPAILGFIAQRFPAARLAPVDDPFAFGEVQAFNSYLCSTVHVAHAHGGRGYRWADDESSFADMKRKVPQTMRECFNLIETRMLRGPWVCGDAYTICDPYLFTISGWLARDQVDIAEFPKVKAHADAMNKRAAVQNVLQAQAA
jgi:glutathione S-transferase